MCLGQLPHEVSCFIAQPASCFDGHHNQPTAPRRHELWVLRFLVSSCVVQRDSVHIGCPSLLVTPRRVVEARQVLGQHLDSPFVCSSHTHVHITQIRIELDASPCLPAYSCKHLLGGCGSLAYPPCARARGSVAPPKIKKFLTTLAHRTGDGQRKGQPLQQHHSKQVWSGGR